MANEEKKDFNAMLHRANGMPKVQLVTDEATVKKYGGTRMYFAPPLAYDTLMRQVPPGRLTTVGELRALLARRALADFTDPHHRGHFCIHCRMGKFSVGRQTRRPIGAP